MKAPGPGGIFFVAPIKKKNRVIKTVEIFFNKNDFSENLYTKNY